MNKKYILFAVLVPIVGLTIYTASNMPSSLEVYEVEQVIDSRDEAQKQADQMAAFKRQLTEARGLIAKFAIQEEDISRTLDRVRRELRETYALEEDIENSILSLADYMISPKVESFNNTK